MMRYIKWVLLLILVVSLVIFGIKFLNYGKFKIEDIYEQTWIRKGISLYDSENELVASNDFIINDHYIIFSDNEISYCNALDNKCDNYSYKFKNGKITINGDEDFMYNGTYDLKYENDILELSIIEDGNKTIYYFIHLLG